MRQLKVFVFGKGLLSFATFIAAGIGAATGFGLMPAAIIAAAGGAAFTAVRRFHQQGIYEEKMVEVYRDRIAEQLGIAPEDVTRAHLREVAPVNPVIAEALNQQHKKTILTIGTSILAGIVSVGLLFTFGMHALQGLATESLTGMLAPVAKFVGIGTISALCGLVVHDGLDAIIGYSSGISRANTHDRIMSLHSRLKRGKAISREEVYSVLVASNPTLDQTIRDRFGKHYQEMNPAEQSRVLRYLGVEKQMDALTESMMQGKIAPAQLADAAVGKTPASAETLPTVDTSPTISFVDRLGLAPRSASAGHEAQLLANRAANPSLEAVR